jgi:hypothetical protein
LGGDWREIEIERTLSFSLLRFCPDKTDLVRSTKFLSLFFLTQELHWYSPKQDTLKRTLHSSPWN